jgi:hypothetical protein
MKVRNVFGLMLSVVLLLVAAGSSLAGEPQPTGPSEAVGVNASPAANAPWFNIYVDTPGDVGQYASVAIDPVNNTTYVSYYDATNKALRMAMNRGFGLGNCGPNNSWLCQTVDSGGDVGKYSSIAIKPASGGIGIYEPEIGIAYYDATDPTNGKLKYAYAAICPTCSWSIITVDEPLLNNINVGAYSSLKYNSNGTPNIAYYFERIGGGNDALKVASYVGSGGNCGFGGAPGKWQCDTIQTGDRVGQYASLALDGAGNSHIAYYDGGNGDLWYATSSIGANCGPGGNTWLCYSVDWLNNVGQYASLYVDNNNDFHIAYFDATIDALKYAFDKGSGGNCGPLGSAQCDTIDDMQAGSHPLGVSIAEDAASYPIIAYQSKGGGLNVARPLSALGLPAGSGNCGPEIPFSTWDCEMINFPIGARHGDFVSIDLSSSGLATIAYYGFITSSGGNLKVAYQQFQGFLPLVMKNQ